MDIKELETEIRAAIDSHLKAGGKLICRKFISDDQSCKCPLSCLALNDKDAPKLIVTGSLAGDEVMKILVNKGYQGRAEYVNFYVGFDDRNLEGLSIYLEQFYNLGKQLREEYKPGTLYKGEYVPWSNS